MLQYRQQTIEAQDVAKSEAMFRNYGQKPDER
jgi:hypothetical protein